MTKDQAHRAMQTLEDVFTPEGDAVVIERLYTFGDPAASLYGRGQCAKVTGREHFGTWYALSDLSATEDL